MKNNIKTSPPINKSRILRAAMVLSKLNFGASSYILIDGRRPTMKKLCNIEMQMGMSFEEFLKL